MENFSNQHTATDTFQNTSPKYTALVVKANAAGIASLALAPKAPELPGAAPSAPELPAPSPLGRGKGYDAVMSWKDDKPEPDLLGYAIVSRNTTSPVWEKEVFVGKTTTYTLPNVNIDEVVLGVKAIDQDGNESPVVAYVAPPYRQPKIPTY
jgi:hypothetical protein